MSGRVISGFGRGSKELGIPTANLPVDSGPQTSWLSSAVSGVYFGWAALRLPENHPDLPSASPSSSAQNGFTIYPMVMSIGYNPFYKNTVRSAEVHVLHKFSADFYGAEMRLLILGFVREEKDYSSLDALVADILFDCDVAKRSLARKGWAPKGVAVSIVGFPPEDGPSADKGKDWTGETVVVQDGELEAGWLWWPSELSEEEEKKRDGEKQE
jgi:riboflavin kinase